MDSEQRERLLLARSDELEREYGDLVRALDAAYEAVRSINAALAENRAESRRVFQERLTVAASPKENGLCRNGNGDAGAGNGVRLLRRYVAKKLQCSDATVTGPTVRLADQTLLFEKSVVPGNGTSSSSNGGRCDSAARHASDAMIAPSIISYQQQQQQQRTTAVNHHHHYHHHRTTTTAAQLQSAARGAYVGDEHSYAEKDGSDEGKDDDEEPIQPAPAAGILNGGAPTWHAVFDGEEDNRVTAEEEVTHGEMDLSIVKCEWPDETTDSTCPTSTTTIASPVIQPQPTTTTTSSSEAKPVQPKSGVKTVGRLITISATLTQSQRKRGRPPISWRSVQEEDEDLKRKRRQTRDRMRRWRAKKRLERQLVIGKHGM